MIYLPSVYKERKEFSLLRTLKKWSTKFISTNLLNHLQKPYYHSGIVHVKSILDRSWHSLARNPQLKEKFAERRRTIGKKSEGSRERTRGWLASRKKEGGKGPLNTIVLFSPWRASCIRQKVFARTIYARTSDARCGQLHTMLEARGLESRRSAGAAAMQAGRVYRRAVAHAINVQTASMVIPFPYGKRQCSPLVGPCTISRNTGRSRPPSIMQPAVAIVY